LCPLVLFIARYTLLRVTRRSFDFVIRLKRIYNFLYSMLVYTPFAVSFVTLHSVFMHFSELTY
jgi:hypothetical protein